LLRNKCSDYIASPSHPTTTTFPLLFLSSSSPPFHKIPKIMEKIGKLTSQRTISNKIPPQLYTLPSRLAYTSWSSADTTTYKGPTPAIVTKLASDTRATLGATYCVSESGTAGPTGGSTRNRTPGYVALAVVRLVKAKGGEDEVRVWTKEVETGSKEREENMVAFAVSALQLVSEVIVGGEGVGEGTVVVAGKKEEEGAKM